MTKQHGLYKYVTTDTNEIIYIGKTNSNFESRIKQHAKGKETDSKFLEYISKTKVFIAELPNRTETDILEKALINKYKPILNAQDKFESKSNYINIIEPEWKEYSEYKKEIFNKNNTDHPSVYQIRYSEEKYRCYVSDVEHLKTIVGLEKYVFDKKEYVADDWIAIKGRAYHKGKIINWQIIAIGIIDISNQVIEEYADYAKYAKERGCPISKPIHAIYLQNIDRINKVYDECIRFVENKEREERRLEEKELLEEEKKIRKAINFFYKNQPLYIFVPYESKDYFKRCGCWWDADLQLWCVNENTWKYFQNPYIFLKRLIPEQAKVAIEQGLITVDDLLKKAQKKYYKYLIDLAQDNVDYEKYVLTKNKKIIE